MLRSTAYLRQKLTTCFILCPKVSSNLTFHCNNCNPNLSTDLLRSGGVGNVYTLIPHFISFAFAGWLCCIAQRGLGAHHTASDLVTNSRQYHSLWCGPFLLKAQVSVSFSNPT